MAFVTLAHGGSDDTGVLAVKLVIGKMHYNQGHGFGDHAWKMNHPQAMHFLVQNRVYCLVFPGKNVSVTQS